MPPPETTHLKTSLKDKQERNFNGGKESCHQQDGYTNFIQEFLPQDLTIGLYQLFIGHVPAVATPQTTPFLLEVRVTCAISHDKR